MGHFSTERKHSWWPQAAHLHRLCSNQLALFISGWCRLWAGRGEAPTLSQRWVAGFPYVISCALASNTKGDVSSPQFHKRTLGRGDVTWLVQGHPAIRGQAGDFVSWMKRVKAMGCLLLETTSQVDQWAHNFRTRVWFCESLCEEARFLAWWTEPHIWILSFPNNPCLCPLSNKGGWMCPHL